MKIKTFILTFLMMMSSPFLFGQDHWTDPNIGHDSNMSVSAEVYLDGTLQKQPYQVAVFFENTLLEVSSIVLSPTGNDFYHVDFVIPSLYEDGSPMDDMYFKLFNGEDEYISATKLDFVYQGSIPHGAPLRIDFKSVAKINGEAYGVVYPTIDEALAAAQNGDEVLIYAGTYDQDLNINKDITVACVEGVVWLADNRKLSITADGATVKNIYVYNPAGNGLYINAKDVLVEDCSIQGANGVRNSYTDGTVTFRNTYIGGGTYGIHFDGSTGGNIVIEGGEIAGWTSFASSIESVSITGTVFADDAYYKILRFYQNATVENCTFPAGMRIDTGNGGTGMEGLELHFNDCTLTDGDIEDAFPGSVIVASDIYVNGELLRREARIGGVYYETLAEAFAAAQNGDEVTILEAGTYALSTSGKNITITGDVEGVVFDNIGSKNMGGANVTFNNVTFDYYPNVNYTGLQHSGELKYNNCKINGQVFLYGTKEVFNNCTFDQNSADAYNVWTYGAREVDFTECTFNSVGKSVLIYAEGASIFNDVDVENCTFNASAPVDGKAAIEMDSSLTAGIELEITNSTATGFANGNVSGNSLWNNKKGNNTPENNDITVVVDGVTVLQPLYVAQIGEVKYPTLQSAINAAQAGDEIVLLNNVTEDVTISKNLTIDGANAEGGKFDYTGTMTANKGLTVTVQNIDFVGGGFNKPDKSATGKYTIKNCTFEGDGDYAYAFSFRGASSVTIEDCTVKNYLYSFLYISSGTNNVSVTNVTVEDCQNYAVYFASGVNTATIENLTVKNSNNGFVINNTANRALTLKNCKLENVNNAINHSSGTNTITCTLLGNENDFGTSASSQYAKYVLTAADATLTAPEEGFVVTTTVENSLVKYVDGAYKVVPAVAKIGDVCYETLADAIAAIGAGDVVIELLANVSLDITAWQTLAIGGDNTTSITIDGDNGEEEDFTLTFKKLNSDWNHVATSNDNTTKLILENLKLADSGYNNGPWNRYDIVFASDVELTNVVSAKALAFKADATLNNVTINESGDNYAIWIQPNGQSVTIDGLVINSAGRGIKVDEQYVTAQNVSLSVANATFTTAKKAAIMVKSSANTTITVGENVNIDNVAADHTNIAWVDEDAAAHYGKVTVTGGTLTQENLPVFVAALMNGAKVEGYYKVFEEALAAAANEKILVLKTVVFDTDKTIDFEGKEVNSNVNPAFRITNGATVTVKNGNMNTAEGYNFILGASDSSSAGNLTIENGTFHGATTVASVTMGSLNITGGEFSVEPYEGNYAYLINCIDDNYVAGTASVSIKGGKFHNWNPQDNAAEGPGTNFCEAGYAALETSENVWEVVPAVAKIGTVDYASLQSAINAAADGDEIDIIANHELTWDGTTMSANGTYAVYALVEDKTLTIDLNGMTISVDTDKYNGDEFGIIAAGDKGILTLTDSSTEGTGAINATGEKGCILLWSRGGSSMFTIEAGNYYLQNGNEGNGMVYAGNNEIVVVNGGKFTLGNVGTGVNESPWIFNVSGNNQRHVIVNGGTFNADIVHQYWCFEVNVPETKAMRNNGDGTWTVADAVAYVDEQVDGGSYNWFTNKVGYTTLAEAVAAAGVSAKPDYIETVTMVKDVTIEETINVEETYNLILDLNDKTISQEKVCTESYNMITNRGTLSIKGEGLIQFKDLSDGGGDSWGSYIINNYGELTVADATIKHLGTADDNHDTSLPIQNYAGKVTINSGVISSPEFRSVRDFTAGGEIVINGGTFEGQVWMQGLGNGSSTLTITGGEFSPAAGYDASSVYVSNGTNDVIVSIEGGKFNTKIGCANAEKDGIKGCITGGIFTTSAKENTNAALLNENYAFVYNDNDTWTVMPAQQQHLLSGWNWYSTYLGIDLAQLETALGENGLIIKGQTQDDGFVQYATGNNGTGVWIGNFDLNYSKMYMIKTSQACVLNLSGEMLNTADHTITVIPGWNWIGYPSSKTVEINAALEGLTPKEGDIIKTMNAHAEYFMQMWIGGLTSMIPGEGYMYKNTDGTTKTFKYNVDAKGIAEPNMTMADNYWKPEVKEYPHNMTMTAVVEGIEGGDYEVAAFVGGELRGSARPIYVEQLDSYMLFLTVLGDEVEEMTFRYYDLATGEEYELANRINYSNDAVVGSVLEPYVFTRGTTGIGENSLDNFNIYPNPTTIGNEVNLNATCEKVEVFNALGVKVAEYQNVDSIDAFETAGIYVIRVTNSGDVRHCRLVVK